MNIDHEMPLGINMNLPSEQYHAGPGISSTDLKVLTGGATPRHLYAYWERKKRQLEDEADEETSKDLAFGSAYHCAVLEPERFAEEYAEPLNPEAFVGALDTIDDLKEALKVHGLKTSGKKDELTARLLEVDPGAQVKIELVRLHGEKNLGKRLLSWSDWTTIEAMRAELFTHPEIAQTLSQGDAEVTMVWDDPETGLRCKIRPDWIRKLASGESFVMDLKTTKSATPESFSRDVYNYGYHISAAFYLDGYLAVTGENITRFAFVPQEKAEPYVPAMRLITREALAEGRREYRRALRIIAECVNSGRWPGYDGIDECGLPPWHRPRAERPVRSIAA